MKFTISQFTYHNILAGKQKAKIMGKHGELFPANQRLRLGVKLKQMQCRVKYIPVK